MSAVLTGVAALDVSTLENNPDRKLKRLYCKPCDVIWVDSPTCWSCYEPGELYVAPPKKL